MPHSIVWTPARIAASLRPLQSKFVRRTILAQELDFSTSLRTAPGPARFAKKRTIALSDRAGRLGLTCMSSRSEVDEAEDVKTLIESADPLAGPRTREWAAHLRPGDS